MKYSDIKVQIDNYNRAKGPLRSALGDQKGITQLKLFLSDAAKKGIPLSETLAEAALAKVKEILEAFYFTTKENSASRHVFDELNTTVAQESYDYALASAAANEKKRKEQQQVEAIKKNLISEFVCYGNVTEEIATSALNYLEESGISIVENNLDLSCASPFIANLIVLLHHAKILTRDNFDVIKSLTFMHVEVKILPLLGEILNQANFDKLFSMKFNSCAFNVIEILQMKKQLTQVNFDLLCEENANLSYSLPPILTTITNATTLSSDDFKILLKIEDLNSLNLILDRLSQARILTANLDFILAAQNLSELGEALRIFSYSAPITQEIFNYVKESAHPVKLAYSFVVLHHLGLLTSANHDIIKSYPNLRLLLALSNNHLLTQPNLERMSPYRHVFFHQTMENMLAMLPDHLTQTVFYEMIRICQQMDGDVLQTHQALSNFCNQLINPNLQNEVYEVDEVDGINYEQSTHNAEVHKSVSESAGRLYNQYGYKIDSLDKLNQIIHEIESWAEKFPDTDDLLGVHYGPNRRRLIQDVPPESKQAVAKRAIFTRRVFEIDFTDSASSISMRQMFALYWIAIHDDQMRHPQTSVKEAENLFIEVLYQIQREYTFLNQPKNSEYYYDVGGPDKFSCLVGTFNKPADIFRSVHPFVSVNMSSKKFAEMRLPIVVAEEVRKYLMDLNEKNNALLQEYLNKKPADLIDIIWPAIQQEVGLRMQQEFSAAFSDGELEKFIQELGADTNIAPVIEELKSTFKKAESFSQQLGLFVSQPDNNNHTYDNQNQALKDLHQARAARKDK